MKVSVEDIYKANKVIQKYIRPTPLLHNPWLSEELGCEIHLKLESMQPIGSFKIRGAINRIAQLTPAEKHKGVVAASAGNHAQGVAWACREMGTKALIVMPRGASMTKLQNTKRLGAEVTLEGDSFEDAVHAAQKLCQKTNRVYIHAYQDPAIIAGQGTIALEIMDQLPKVDAVFASIGGGGLIGGIATFLRGVSPTTQIIGCQAAGASPMVKSIRRRKSIRVQQSHTFADGIAMAKASDVMRKLIAPMLDRVLEVEDEAIAESVLVLLEKAKIVAEGAGAAPLAALKNVRKLFKNKKVVLVVSGGNIDVNMVSRIVDRGLIHTGRRLKINVLVPDRPGSLHRLTGIIAAEGANVLQAFHDRNEPLGTVEQIHIALTLETKGPEHSAQVIEKIKGFVDYFELAH